MILFIEVNNSTGGPLGDMAIKFQPNSFGLNPDSTALSGASIINGDTQAFEIPIEVGKNNSNSAPATPFKVNVALKTSVDIFVM